MPKKDRSVNFNEPTMEERLAIIDVVKYNEANNTATQEVSLPKPPSADSVHIMLKHALHAEDHTSLLECLYTKDEKVITKSTSLLSPVDALKLLKSLVSLIQSRGAVLVCILPWLRSLLRQHVSSIISQKSSLQALNSLNQLIDSRCSTFGSALQFSNRIDYLFAGVPDGDDDDDDDNAEEESSRPAVIYEDKDSDDEASDVDVMEEDDGEEFGAVYNSPCHGNSDSDGSDIMSD